MLSNKSRVRRINEKADLRYNNPCKLPTFKECIMHKSANASGQLALLHDDSIAPSDHVKIENKGRGRPVKDLTGNRYGRLVVVELTDERQHGNPVWICRCDCGSIVKMATSSFRAGTKSCGCIGFGRKRYTTRRGGVGSLQGGSLTFERQVRANAESLFSKYRRAAIKRGYEWRLTYVEFLRIVVQDCHYCGEPPAQEHVVRAGRTDGQPFIYNGIDRVDNARGYETGNVVPCCGVCNTAKLDRDKGEFIEWARRVAERADKEPT
jgi:hypothetical protein